jgi:hypothetical protein
MKIMIMMLQLLVGVNNDSMELIVDVQAPIGKCELYMIEDDCLIEQVTPVVNRSKIYLYLDQYKDYYLVINNGISITITINANEIIDDRDVDISADTEYEFTNGVFVFEPVTYVKK